MLTPNTGRKKKLTNRQVKPTTSSQKTFWEMLLLTLLVVVGETIPQHLFPLGSTQIRPADDRDSPSHSIDPPQAVAAPNKERGCTDITPGQQQTTAATTTATSTRTRAAPPPLHTLGGATAAARETNSCWCRLLAPWI